MGVTTDFVGHIDITPPLNEAECQYLTAFAQSRRWDRPGGPYVVPGNPRVDDRDGADVDRYNTRAPGQPQLWCQWVPCAQGDCLAWDGNEKFYAPVEWMRYLVDHFLSPTAEARVVDDPAFRDFTFDHVLNGTIVGCRRDNRELYTVEVRENRVTTQVLRPGDPEDRGYQLPYEEQDDFWQQRRSRRRRNRNEVDAEPPGVVVALEARRPTR